MSLELIEQVKTPAFVYSYEDLVDTMGTIQQVIGEVGAGNWIAYSYKTNPNLAPYLAAQGCAMQVTSVGHLAEISSLLDASVMKNCFYCSGSMAAEDADLVVKSDVYIVVDSLSQLETVSQAAERNGQQPRVLVRVDAGQTAIDSPFGTSGMLQGIDLKCLQDLLNEPRKNIRIVGIHNHFGSQVNSLNAWKQNIEAIAAAVCELDYPLEVLNLGGGIPIPYDNVKSLSIYEIYSRCLFPSLERIKQVHPELRLVVEPGRFLVGPCGYLVTQVTNLHSTSTKRGANLDVSLFAAFQDRFLSNLEFQLPVLKPQASTMESAETILRGSSPASIDYFGVYNNLAPRTISACQSADFLHWVSLVPNEYLQGYYDYYDTEAFHKTANAPV